MRVNQVYHAAQGQGERARSAPPHRLPGLDPVWSCVGNPHRRDAVAGCGRRLASRRAGSLTVGEKADWDRLGGSSSQDLAQKPRDLTCIYQNMDGAISK
jgi:hypothetical protein